MIKVITGIRRCGKSYLLFNLFYNYLINSGIKEDHIIKIALDDRMNKNFRDPDEMLNYVYDSIKDKEMYYILLDEVQFMNEFEDVLNSFLHIDNVDTYVTGSNAKFLSKDIITEFRGRGDQIHIQPLTFAEYYSVYNGSKDNAWNEYIKYGGLPKTIEFTSPKDKTDYLNNIFSETYIKDIISRYNVKNEPELEELLDILASSIGSLTNPKKLADTFKSIKNISMHENTIKKYLDYFVDSFLISKVKRYDVKGKKYINTPSKYYFTDLGLRNARINYRQLEETHIMENIIYNELIARGFSVDVGIVEINDKNKYGSYSLKQLEVDFVCNFGDKRYYIQSALELPTREKTIQEEKSLLNINDSFKKIIIVKNTISSWYNEEGILIINLFDFLLNPDILNY
jgi:uncharacterized protein